MRLLHTADWHIGKTLKGRGRLDEQRAVLGQIVAHARTHEVDAVLIAGDVYDSAAPSTDAQQLVVQALLALRQTGAEVVVLAGNHDSAGSFDAYRPLMGAAGITVVGRIRRADAGGVIRFTARSTGEPVAVAVLPFLSQRYAVRAAQLVADTPDELSRSYDAMYREIVDGLTAEFAADEIRIVMGHVTVIGGTQGGGERQAQSIFEYSVPAAVFPATAHYVALGHLHRRQTLPAACPVVYSGAPLAVDFGEQDNDPVVCLVTAAPDVPAVVTDLPVTAGRRLRTLTGTVAEILAHADDVDAQEREYLRVWVREPARAGLREEITQALPNALEVRIDPEFAAPVTTGRAEQAGRADRSPAELFADFCAERNVVDPRVQALFGRLHDEVTGEGRE